MLIGILWLSVAFVVLTLIFEGLDRWNNLPEHINSPDKWLGKDDSQHWYTDWKRYVKSWFAYDWKKRHWFGSLRKFPVTLLALFGPGESRWENDVFALRSTNNAVMWYWPPKNGFYLSRVQYWCDWHLMVQWPLFIGFHLKIGRTKLLNAYFGFKKDTDVYWFPSLYLGNKWK